jgi:hypothetical protein
MRVRRTRRIHRLNTLRRISLVPEEGRLRQLRVQGRFLVEVGVEGALGRGVVFQRHGAGEGVLRAGTGVLGDAAEFGIGHVGRAVPDGVDGVEGREERLGFCGGAGVVEAEVENCLCVEG